MPTTRTGDDQMSADEALARRLQQEESEAHAEDQANARATFLQHVSAAPPTRAPPSQASAGYGTERINVAPSGRSKCHECDNFIARGELRWQRNRNFYCLDCLPIRHHIRTVNLPGFRQLNTEQQNLARRRIASAAARAAREGRYEEYRRNPNAPADRAPENPLEVLQRVLSQQPNPNPGEVLPAPVRRRQQLVAHLRERLRNLGMMGVPLHQIIMMGNGGHQPGELAPERKATKKEINALPKCRVRADEDLGACCICLDEMTKGVQVRKLPCNHKYHPKCIDKWLERNKCCPMCKQDIA